MTTFLATCQNKANFQCPCKQSSYNHKRSMITVTTKKAEAKQIAWEVWLKEKDHYIINAYSEPYYYPPVNCQWHLHKVMEKASSCGAEETAQRSSGETGLCPLQYGPKDFLLWPVNHTINTFRWLTYYDDCMVMTYNSRVFKISRKPGWGCKVISRCYVWKF